jgi:hypothetical protein
MCNTCSFRGTLSNDRHPNFAIWWQRGWFAPWYGCMRTLDGRGCMLWIGRLHFGVQL